LSATERGVAAAFVMTGTVLCAMRELPRGGPFVPDVYLKLAIASFSVSYVSNTVSSFVMASRS
jgi:hypothetical protein